MRRTFQLALFLTIVISTIVLLHSYVWIRLVRDLSWPSLWKQILSALLISLGVILFSVMPVYRIASRRSSSLVAWIGYTWMGLLVFLCLLLFVTDLIKWTFLLFSSSDLFRMQFGSEILSLFALVTAIFIGLYSFVQAIRFPYVRYVQIVLPRLDPRLTGFRIVQLSDLHIGPTLGKSWLQRIVLATNELLPDVVAITGDLVDGTVSQLREEVSPLEGLKAKHGTFFVTGNHEYYSGADAWIQELNRLGVRVLANECVHIRTEEQATIDIAGIHDQHSSSFPGHGPNLSTALQNHDPAHCVILLAHQPAAIEEASAHQVDLQLSGHTHAGQLWPWNYFVRLQQPYVVGLHRRKNTQIYISPGTGYWGPPMRFLSRAEITHITLLPNQEFEYSREAT